MRTIEEAFTEIQHATPAHTMRDARGLRAGEVAHQGDIYLHRVQDDHPRGALLGTRKLAIGQGEGSNHMIEGDAEVYAGTHYPPGFTEPSWVPERALLGPVVVVRSEATNTHPQHAHNLLSAGTYQVTYQADYTTRLRAQD